MKYDSLAYYRENNSFCGRRPGYRVGSLDDRKGKIMSGLITIFCVFVLVVLWAILASK